MANVLDSLREFVTPQLLNQAAQMLGENENGISKALGGLAPTILAGLINKTGDANAMGSIFNTLANFNADILNNLGSLIGGGNLAHNDPKDEAGHLFSNLFGDKVPAITNAVAAYSGTKTSSVSSLLGLAGPLVMGLLSRRINTEGLNVSGLSNLLLQQKNIVLGTLPAGVGSLLGFAEERSVSQDAATTEQSIGNRWLMPLLLLLALGLGIMYIARNCTQPVEKVVVAPAADTMQIQTAVPADYKRKLASGFEVKGNVDGIESKLIAFIESSAPVDKTTWFSFDRLTFQTGSATIDMEKSQGQLANITEILKAYPKVKLKVGGYTDNVGDPKSNMKLSQARAESTLNALVAMGIEKPRLEAEGYGEQHPVAANDTEEGRAQNRRIDVRVMEK
ncbi:MAG: OmpA family protein [Saprospiraceae bacterium]|nr:OmpA family protein [Saprospiraceae bacterium]